MLRLTITAARQELQYIPKRNDSDIHKTGKVNIVQR